MSNFAVMESWDTYQDHLSAALAGLEVTDRSGTPMSAGDGFLRWVQLTRDVHDAGRCLYFVGNGGSAMIASHMAVDASKNGGLRAQAFNDPAFLTAISNDISFDEVFALPLAQFGRTGDLLITISSSGNSPNVVRALETGRRIGMHLVTLSGKGPQNRSRAMGDLNLYVPADRYGWVECAHQVVIHYWFDQYLNVHGKGAL
jgi:D-sedoheptulose 7-phosphate isomerase